jgi:redox-sensing transcriptional repressor
MGVETWFTGTSQMPRIHGTPDRTIERLSFYRRLLRAESEKGTKNLYSHQLAALAGVTPAQIRRDLTYVGYSGNPQHGYQVDQLREAVERYLSPRGQVHLALVGVGNLGRAILAYFSGRHRKLVIKAIFDSDPQKAGRVLQGCRCYPMEDLVEVVRREDIVAAIITVPAGEAQKVADALVTAGVKGILNFAPATLRVGGDVYVETKDLTMAMEKVAFFAQARQQVSEVTS